MIRDLNKIQIESLLHREAVGRLGCYAQERIYVVPLGFVYHDGQILAHSGLGMKVEMMRENPQVCFEVDHVDDLANWQSVIVWGQFEELQGEEAEHALHALVSRLAPLLPQEDTRPTDGPDGASTRHVLSRSSRHGIVFRIRIEEMTGRSEQR